MVSACARPSTRTPPPTLREVTLADLGDVGRLLALHEQARARGWLRGGEAEQLNVVAAAVHGAAGGPGAVSAVRGAAAGSTLGGDHAGGRGPGPPVAAGACGRPMPA